MGDGFPVAGLLMRRKPWRRRSWANSVMIVVIPYFIYHSYMTTLYATVTSKGQITLPVAARRLLGISAGQKLEMRVEGDSLVIAKPTQIDGLRERVRDEAMKKGTWGIVPVSGDGWDARAEDFRANS